MGTIKEVSRCVDLLLHDTGLVSIMRETSSVRFVQFSDYEQAVKAFNLVGVPSELWESDGVDSWRIPLSKLEVELVLAGIDQVLGGA